MENWKDIHEDFGNELHYSGYTKTFPQIWKERGLTYQDAQSWIKTGLTPDEHEFASYLRHKNHQPNQDLNLWELREEFNAWKQSKPAQEYFNIIYPKEQRNTIKWLVTYREKLTGNLDLSDFVNLEVLNCEDNQLTSLNITNCQQLKELDCNRNKLTDLILPASAKQLTYLRISDNNLSDLSLFSHLVNLEWLDIDNNPLTGSLKPLQNLTKLKRLNINNTDIDSGLEYLPASLQEFYCSAYYRKEAKCQTLEKEIKKQKKFYEIEMPGNITLLKRWKQAKLPKLSKKTLQDQLKLLQEQKEKLLQRITDLETLTKESERLIKEQKSKIGENIKNYLPLFEEEDKQSVEKLIKVHKAHKEAEKARQWNEADELFGDFSNIRKKLKNKLGKDFMEIITMVLANLEEFYQREWDLTKQLQEKEQIPNSLKAIEKNIADINKNIKALEANPNQTINNYITTGDINVEHGHAMIGNTIGSQANLSHNQYATTIEEVEEIEFQAQILQPTNPPHKN